MTAAPVPSSSGEDGDDAAAQDPSLPEEAESEAERLKRESRAMVRLLKKLEAEEMELTMQNEILAREALLCGFDPGVLEPPAPKRRGAMLGGGGGGPGAKSAATTTSGTKEDS
jgi:hypothetical protein